MNSLKMIVALSLCALCCDCGTIKNNIRQAKMAEEARRGADEEAKKKDQEFWDSMRPENVELRNKQRREAYVKGHPELAEETRNDILSGMIRIGMTTDQVEASCGKPFSGVNSTVTSRGRHEQWVYDDCYLYFENSMLTSYQTFHR
jgi:hypothetical protein